ncbi:plasmid pRiA4b ORF-3 family protein [Actinoplanes sp. CA-015351]|uniref:plasmid pRiA4b ORF-3 family protein n=1 Tax=Actinoplanes sp. CA-015351 TaxID=3239897 RepID=UPI003D9729DC
MSESDLAAIAASAPVLRQVTALTRWVGEGRTLTQTGQLTMADARHLVDALGTGDEIDPSIGDRVYRTRSSADLPILTLVLGWAKAAGMVRVVNGRLVPVKKNRQLLDQPLQLWAAMFAAFDQLGSVICPPGYFSSLFEEEFADGTAVLFAAIAEGGGTASISATQERIWLTLSARFYLDEATEEQMRILRGTTDNDTSRAIAALVALDAVEAGTTLRFTSLAEWALRAAFGTGDRIAQLTVTLQDTEPPVWRRVLVPATIRLDRLHHVLQAVMGWTDSHMHMFVHATGSYGHPDPELELTDERKTTLNALAKAEGDTFTYEYDFGDGWDHEIRLENLLRAEPTGRYPVCVDGARACPPEDCGGTPGYADLVKTLADPARPGHQDLLRWLGIDKPGDFDPARFDPADTNRRLDAAVLSARPGH